MIQCGECEYFHEGENGEIAFSCDPFQNIKEPECLVKWQVIKLDTMVRAYQATLRMYERLAPLQERMFRHMEREIQDQEDADSWKQNPDDDDDDDDEYDDEDTQAF